MQIDPWGQRRDIIESLVGNFFFIYMVMWGSEAGGLNEIQAAEDDVLYYNMNLDINTCRKRNADRKRNNRDNGEYITVCISWRIVIIIFLSEDAGLYT